ncbi:MAG: TonB-dependent receptor [Chitinophagaceae bacterium]
MKYKKCFSLLLLMICSWQITTYAQRTGKLSGSIIDKQTQKQIQGATIQLSNGNKTISDSLGKFRFSSLPTGTYNITISAIGFNTITRFNNIVTSGNELELTVELEPSIQQLSNVTVVASGRRTVKAATIETPLSVQRLTFEEIRANPGGNFDISKVIQSLPGVGGGIAGGGFRNDIIIRGGAPNENVFYLDGIELPTINHFATQGAGGGPQGILNVSFIEDVKLSTSAFDAQFDNTLSSVFEFKQKKGNANKLQGNVRLSATELATTLEGPLVKSAKPTTFLVSARRSYLQLLFSAIDLPIRPNYWDFQFKTTTQLSPKTTLTTLGVGAIDQFSFAAPKEATPEKLYALNSNPSIQQKSYTVGVAIKHLLPKGYWNLALSRNVLDNQLDRFSNNLQPVEAERTLLFRSVEAENKLRFTVNTNVGGIKWTYGATAQLAQFNNNTFARLNTNPIATINVNSSINVARLGAFIQAGKRFWDNRLGISAGIRADGNSFTTNGWNVGNTLSPRLSVNYVLADKWNVNASVGRYAKLVPFTILGFRDNAGNLANKNADYTISNHLVAGIEHIPSNDLRITFEGFYKTYQNVPISVQKGISLANLGSDFNILGNEAVITNGKGRSFGFEFFAQKKLTKRFFGILSYTFYKSEYTNANGEYAPSSWDNRHLISYTMGYKLNRNWEIGLKFRYQGGAPFTPYDDAASRANFLTTGEGVLNYGLLNTQRLNAFNAADIRIDKKWNYKKFTFDLFLDITNFYAAKAWQPDVYTFRRNATNTAFLTTDGQPIQQNGSNALPFLLSNSEGTLLPTIGFIVEF